MARRTEALQRLRRLPFGSLWKRLADFCSSHTGLFSFLRQSKSVPISGRLLLLVCLLIFIFWLCRTACGTLVPWAGIEPAPSALEGQRLNHWATRVFSIRDASLFHPSHKYSQE